MAQVDLFRIAYNGDELLFRLTTSTLQTPNIVIIILLYVDSLILTLDFSGVWLTRWPSKVVQNLYSIFARRQSIPQNITNIKWTKNGCFA